MVEFLTFPHHEWVWRAQLSETSQAQKDKYRRDDLTRLWNQNKLMS